MYVLLASIAAAMLAGAAPVASGAPAEPTLGLAGLQGLLDAAPGGTVPGYFKTVVVGSKIETIPVTVRSIIPGQTLTGSLIFFEASGTVSNAIGGIAAGMSGSPVYVNDGAGDKLVGAVSYGDSFTLGGLGLATPIDDMSALETRYRVKTTVVPLDKAVETRHGAVTRLAIAPDSASARRASGAPGTAVLTPLRVIHLGGLDPHSRVYHALSLQLAKTGATIVPGLASASPSSSGFETTLTGGAAVAALASRGDLLVGGVGTVTYATSDTVVAFGHPAFFTGPSGLYLANAWIHGIWGSAYVPYKLASPGKVRGVFTQDRDSGIAGRTDILPQESPMTAVATMMPDGVAASSTSYATRWAIDNAQLTLLPAASADIALARAINGMSIAGSAQTTSTYVITDGTTTFTVTRANLFDSADDVESSAVGDLASMGRVWAAVNEEGIYPVHVVSVDYKARVTTARRAATIVDVSVPGGLKTGANRVRVSLIVKGVAATQTVDVGLVIPPRMSLAGTVKAECIASSSDALLSDLIGTSTDLGGVPERRTPAAIVQDILSQPKNSDLLVSYSKGSDPLGAFGGASGLRAAASAPTSVDTSASTPWVLAGRASKPVGVVSLAAVPSKVGYKGSSLIAGIISSVSGDTRVTLFKRVLGTLREKRVAVVRAKMRYGSAFFSYRVRGLTKTTRFSARWDGDADHIGSTGACTVRVAPRPRKH